MIAALLLSLFACEPPEPDPYHEEYCLFGGFFANIDRAEHRKRVMFCKNKLFKNGPIDRKGLVPMYDELMLDPSLLEDPEICQGVLHDMRDDSRSVVVYAMWVTSRYKVLYPDRPPSCVEVAMPHGPPNIGWLPMPEEPECASRYAEPCTCD